MVGQSAYFPAQPVRQFGGTFGVALAIAAPGAAALWWIIIAATGQATSPVSVPLRTTRVVGGPMVVSAID